LPDEGERSSSPVARRTFMGALWAIWATALGWLQTATCGVAAVQEKTAKNEEAPMPKEITERTIAEAEKLADLTFTDEERAQIVGGRKLGDFTTLRSVSLENEDPPAEIFDPRLPGTTLPQDEGKSLWLTTDVGPLPSREEDIAFASVSQLHVWLREHKITSERLTCLYLDRLKRFGPPLQCVVTLTEELAMEQAKRADAELVAGKVRGPLHGIPWGAKDLFDTKGVATTWGAMPFRTRVAERDAKVVDRLSEAGAVLVAKLTLGALAYGDIWFAGRTNNPWNPKQGSSGSSAGSAAAAAAGLVGFTLGTETSGSIASPCARSGATGLRPTFGRVSRAGTMALCWSLDKVGPICRTAYDCALVLDAIHGVDPEDPSTVDVPLRFDFETPTVQLRVGYDPAHYVPPIANLADRQSLDALQRLGFQLVPVTCPSGPYGDIISILLRVEAATAFDELTRENRDDELVWQEPKAWPNTFRQTRFVPAVEYVRARRVRRRFMQQADAFFKEIDVFIAPQAHGDTHWLTNLTGHPALTLRQQFRDDGTPRALTMWGRLYGESSLLRVGSALEEALGLWSRRPPLG